MLSSEKKQRNNRVHSYWHNLSIICVAFAILFLSACSGSVPNEKKIKEDLANSSGNHFKATETIDKVEVIKRSTDKDSKEDEVWCKVDSHNEEAEYIKYFTLYYKLYDKGGWLLDEIETDQVDKWSSTPLAGITDEAIKDSIAGLRVKVGNEEWHIDKESIESVTIDDKSTQLDQKKDIVTATLTLNSDVLVSQGQIQLEYLYNNGWRFRDYSVSSPFTSNYKEKEKPQLTDDILISAIHTSEMDFGTGNSKQKIEILQDDISNLSFNIDETKNQGKTQVVSFNFNLNKSVCAFDVTGEASYQYKKGMGWNLERLSFTPTVKSVDLIGKWTGKREIGWVTHESRDLDIEIKNMSSDGSITLFIEWQVSPTAKATYNAEGKFNLKDLTISFQGTEWVVDAEKKNNPFGIYDAVLQADGRKIAGKFDKNYAFEVAKTD